MAQTVSRRSIVYDILFEVEQGKKSAKEAEEALKKIEKTAGKTEGAVKQLGKAFLAAFTVQELARRTAQFVTESINLARAAEGVQKAFSRLNDPNLLSNLRQATRGTVGDLQLMQAAVRAQNFKIPLTQLATYFDFARQRARDTGQSVDYLVNSIIDGIGRKSTLVLDNLGLSASEIQKEFGKTGDLATAVSTIIQREFTNAGDKTLSAADKIDQYNAAIENLKKEIGEELIPVLGKAAELMLEIFSRSAVEDIQKTRAALLDEFEGIIERAPEQFQKLIYGLDASQIKILKTALEIAKATGEPIENLITLEGTIGFATIGFTQLGDAMRLTKKEAEELVKSTEKVLTPFEQLNSRVLLFGQTLKDVFSGKRDANIKGLNDELSALKKELTETDLPIDKVRELTEKIATLEKALASLMQQGKEMPEFALDVSDPLTELNKLIDDSIKKTEEWEKHLEKINKLKFEAPEESSDILTQEAEALAAINAQLQREIELRNTLASIAQSSGQIFSNLSQIVAEGSNAQIGLAIASVIAANAEALAKGVASAIKLPFPANIAAAFTTIATVTGMFAQINALQQQARSAQSQAQANAFAEGEVDIHRPGETRGKDSIPAIIMPGETVTTTEKTSRYKPFLKAIHEGTLEDLIRVNYVEPALAVAALDNAKNNDSTIDYSDKFYRQFRVAVDGNSINKQAIKELRSINKKLSRGKGGWYV